jgi:hypothetical protein
MVVGLLNIEKQLLPLLVRDENIQIPDPSSSGKQQRVISGHIPGTIIYREQLLVS